MPSKQIFRSKYIHDQYAVQASSSSKAIPDLIDSHAEMKDCDTGALASP